MFWYSWNQWYTPVPFSIANGEMFPTVFGFAAGTGKKNTATQENSEKIYLPVRMGWF
jgi:hypothetical protein